MPCVGNEHRVVTVSGVQILDWVETIDCPDREFPEFRVSHMEQARLNSDHLGDPDDVLAEGGNEDLRQSISRLELVQTLGDPRPIVDVGSHLFRVEELFDFHLNE